MVDIDLHTWTRCYIYSRYK